MLESRLLAPDGHSYVSPTPPPPINPLATQQDRGQVTLHNRKKIDGLDYEVAENGDVFSLSRVVHRTDGKRYTVIARKLIPVWNGRHFQVALSDNGKRHRRYVHHLVLEAFVGPRPEGMRALHRDDDPHNNHVSNLYWGTMRDNALDRVRNGNDPGARKTHCKRGHDLTGPNLATWCDNPRHRHCLACNRANSYSRFIGNKDPEYRQELSDQYYRQILLDAQ